MEVAHVKGMTMNYTGVDRRAVLRGAAGIGAVAALGAGSLSTAATAGAAPLPSTLKVVRRFSFGERHHQLQFDSSEVANQPWTTVLLPPSYASSPNRRYPMMFLLHGGGTSAFNFLREAAIKSLVGDREIIVVMPDGGLAGWYSNPVDNRTSPRNFENFHIKQLLPWIDANYRTYGTPSGRAVCGFSMGGYGALKYTARYPQLFSSISAHSGPPSMRRDNGIGIFWANITSMVELGGGTVYGWNWDQSRVSADNAVENIPSYRGKRIFLVAGRDTDDAAPKFGQREFADLLDAAHIGYTHHEDAGGHIFRSNRFTEDLDGIMSHLTPS